MNNEKRFFDEIAEISREISDKSPAKLIEISQLIGIPNPKEEVKRMKAGLRDPLSGVMNLFETVYLWDLVFRETKAQEIGRKIGDLGESTGIFTERNKLLGTPQEHALLGSDTWLYTEKEPYKPICLTTLELFREPKPKLYGFVNDARQHRHLFVPISPALGEEVKNRVDELGIWATDQISMSVEPLDLSGRTTSDPIILDPAFVDVKMDKCWRYAREPMRIVPGEVLYNRLLERSSFRISNNPPPLKHLMSGDELECCGFKKYDIGKRHPGDSDGHYIGKVVVDGKSLFLGYASLSGSYRLVNRPRMSLEGVKPFVPTQR